MRSGPFALVREKMIQRQQEKGTELSLRSIRLGREILLQKAREEALGQILSIFLPIATPPNVGIERVPISAAKFLQCVRGLGNLSLSRRQHDAPVSGGELPTSRKFIRSIIGGHLRNVG